MRLTLSDADAAFRDDLREFFTTQVPEDIRARARAGQPRLPDDVVTAQRILNQRGIAVPNWPVEWGGQDWSPLQRQIWSDELRLACVPEPLAFNASMVGPVIAAFGSRELKERFLSATANLDISVQRSHRLLEDHLDVPPADLAHPVFPGDRSGSPSNRMRPATTSARGARERPQIAREETGLAAARFADELATVSPGLYPVRDPLDGAHDAARRHEVRVRSRLRGATGLPRPPPPAAPRVATGRIHPRRSCSWWGISATQAIYHDADCQARRSRGARLRKRNAAQKNPRARASWVLSRAVSLSTGVALPLIPSDRRRARPLSLLSRAAI